MKFENEEKHTSDLNNPLKINKYSLFLITMDITKLSENDQFNIGYELNEIIKEDYQQSVRADIVAPYVFDYDIKNKSIAYLLCGHFYKETISNGLSQLNIKHTTTDISEEFLNLKIDVINEDESKEEEFKVFLKKLEKFKFPHLTNDKILEKIKSKGITSLSKLEKSFLDNNVLK